MLSHRDGQDEQDKGSQSKFRKHGLWLKQKAEL